MRRLDDLRGFQYDIKLCRGGREVQYLFLNVVRERVGI